MTSTIKRLTGNTIEITLLLSWPEIKAVYDRIFALLLSEVELPGFRKGKARSRLSPRSTYQRAQQPQRPPA